MSPKSNFAQERKVLNTALVKLFKEAEAIAVKLISISKSMASTPQGMEQYQKERTILEAQLDKLTAEIQVLRERYSKLPK